MIARLLMLATVLIAGTVQAVEVKSPLEQDRGKSRPLVIVARTDADPTLVALKKALEEPANKQGFSERNMVLYTIVGIVGKRDSEPLETQVTMSLIRGLKPGMIIDKAKVILIGKDGEKKFEGEGDVDLQALFKIIDALPAAEKETPPPAAAVTPEKGATSGKNAKSVKPAKALED